MNIRQAQASDVEAIANLHLMSWRHAYRGALSDEYLDHEAPEDRRSVWLQRLTQPAPGQFVCVAELDRVVLGFACAYAYRDAHWGSLLDNIHVRPDQHRTGLGTRLLKTIFDWKSAEAADRGLYLWVLQSNQQAQNFYRKQGAEIADEDVWQAPGGAFIPRFRMVWS